MNIREFTTFLKTEGYMYIQSRKGQRYVEYPDGWDTGNPTDENYEVFEKRPRMTFTNDLWDDKSYRVTIVGKDGELYVFLVDRVV